MMRRNCGSKNSSRAAAVYPEAFRHGSIGKARPAPGGRWPRRLIGQASDGEPAQDAPTSAAPEPLTFARMVASCMAAVFIVSVGFVLFHRLDATAANLRPGVVLATADARQQPKDHTVEFPNGMKRTSILVWDYAAEDGDQVEVLVDGQPFHGPFVIRHAPVAVDVPVGAVVEVRGVVDGGGGGVTYAINFPDLRRSFTNGVEPGSGNKYTLVEKPR